MAPVANKDVFPRVTIFAESGPLAGDVAACLLGRFQVERVTNRAAVLKSLASGCRALLIMGWESGALGPADTDLICQALKTKCRVLVLGAGGLHLEQELDSVVVYLPSLPSPQQLMDNLSGLEPGQMAGNS